MDLAALIRAPVRISARVVHALDDLAALAERARRDPDPAEQARDRLDALLLELAVVTEVAREIVEGGAELTRTTKATQATMVELIVGGRELTAVAAALEQDTRELIDGGSRLTAVSELIEADLRVVRAALPRIVEGLGSVEELEGAVETVAETIEPLQGAAERVGRVTQRLSRR
jgi:hypothetical protein